MPGPDRSPPDAAIDTIDVIPGGAGEPAPLGREPPGTDRHQPMWAEQRRQFVVARIDAPVPRVAAWRRDACLVAGVPVHEDRPLLAFPGQRGFAGRPDEILVIRLTVTGRVMDRMEVVRRPGDVGQPACGPSYQSNSM